MTACELCGAETSLSRAIVEGTLLEVCKKCSTYGNIIPLQPLKPSTPPRHITLEEPRDYIVPHYAYLIKQAREQKGWKQQELASHLQEKESLIQHIESGNMTPPFDIALKLQQLLAIKLVVTYE